MRICRFGPVIFAHRSDESADRRRVAAPRHRDEADIAPHLRIDDGPGEDARINGAEFGNETDAEATGHKVEDPVFALAFVGDIESRAVILDEKGEVVAEFTVEPSQIGLAIDIDDCDRRLAGEAMAGRKADEETLLVEHFEIEALGKALGIRHDGNIDLPLFEPLAQMPRNILDEPHADARIA